MIESGTPLGPGFLIFFQQETGNLGRHEYKERYREEYDGGILSQIFTQYTAPDVIEEDPIIEIRVPEEETEKHLKRYVKDHNLNKYMSALIIKEIVKRPDLVKEVQKTHGLERDGAREVLFDSLLEDLEFKIEKDEEDIALLMILIEVI
jgi:hypothetical protein